MYHFLFTKELISLTSLVKEQEHHSRRIQGDNRLKTAGSTHPLQGVV